MRTDTTSWLGDAPGAGPTTAESRSGAPEALGTFLLPGQDGDAATETEGARFSRGGVAAPRLGGAVRAERAALEGQIHGALSHAARKGSQVVLAVVDLDGFWTVNESVGHHGGDAVLDAVYVRLRGHLGGSAVVATLSGDQFAVLGTDFGGTVEAANLGTAALEALAEPIETHAGVFCLTASIGVAVASGGGSAEALLRDADTARRHAKQQGGDRCALFHPSMRPASGPRPAPDLRRALEAEELALVYQPIVDLTEERVSGLEALVRWRHRDRGLLEPSEFLPAAERDGLVARIDAWVLREACSQVARWSREPHARDWATVAVNVSAASLRDAGFCDDVQRILGETGIAASQLVVHVSEPVLGGEDPLAVSRMADLRAAGVWVTLDRVGTAALPLGRLAGLPVDALAVDRALVHRMEAADGAAAVIDALARMTKGLGLSLRADGVESQGQLHALARIGVDRVQGHLFARPMAAQHVRRWLESWRRPPSTMLASTPKVDADETVTLQTAADALGVSASTLRRWADSGRIRAVRTAGRHRRFPVTEVRRVSARGKGKPEPARPRLPSRPAPAVAELISAHGAALRDAAVRAMYDDGHAAGWFASDGARPALSEWTAALAAAFRSGQYQATVAATNGLVRRARLAGASMLERYVFAERFCAALLRASERTGGEPETQAATRRLFAVLRYEILRDE